jgi:hypothetical protein
MLVLIKAEAAIFQQRGPEWIGGMQRLGKGMPVVSVKFLV